MKTIFPFCLLFAFCFTAKAEHITGGEMFYTYAGMVNGEHQYRGTVKLFKNCYSNRPLANPAIISIFDRITGTRIKDITVELSNTETLSLTNPNKCITNPPDVCYAIGYYYFDINVPPSANGYTVSAQFVYRIAGINNLITGYGNVGTTYTAEIPPTQNAVNNSARFVGDDMVAVCANNSFSYSFAATDSDGDQLKYSFCQAYQGGNGGANSGSSASPPPYSSVPYGQGFDGSSPLGKNVQIDAETGLITGIAPAEGVYVVTVCVEEYRNGVLIAMQRKDLQLNIASCTIAAASLLPEYMLCKTTNTLQVSNISTSPLIKTYNWELTNSKGNIVFTETSPGLSYTFTDTGMFKIKLVINKGLECSDSMSSKARVYPGQVTDYNYKGVCLGKPTLFTSIASTVYGQIDKWDWDFGENIDGTDGSAQKNPSFQYAAMGFKKAQLVVHTTTGCMDTVYKTINIVDKPPMVLGFKDSLICVNDKLMLSATAPGGGNFSWVPAYNISGANSSAPIVTPAITTTYFVTLDDNGCVNRDSVKVRVTDRVFLKAMNDTTICQGDTVQLKLESDGFTYSWTNITPQDAALPNPTTIINSTTLYEVTAFIGGCFAKDQVHITTIPYPHVNAGADTIICYNTPAQLSGNTDASKVSWSPTAGVSASNIINPVARPKQNTNYVLTVYDTKGCPKPSRDTVFVKVLPPIHPFAGRDTAVVIGQPLQLNATGGIAYRWSPAFHLSATDTSSPVAVYNSPSEGLKYKVLIYNEAGCADSAYVSVKVFATQPLIFIPTAFTPNGDGRNDKIKPVAAGIRKIEYFNIYNRWGQLVFTTQNSNNGWDGSIGGEVQNTGVFVWLVKAIDYTGKPYFQKGTITLIR
jgi:gliding motility-associated-like protein